jgi:hypothetical protein
MLKVRSNLFSFQSTWGFKVGKLKLFLILFPTSNSVVWKHSLFSISHTRFGDDFVPSMIKQCLWCLPWYGNLPSRVLFTFLEQHRWSTIYCSFCDWLKEALSSVRILQDSLEGYCFLLFMGDNLYSTLVCTYILRQSLEHFYVCSKNMLLTSTSVWTTPLH